MLRVNPPTITLHPFLKDKGKMIKDETRLRGILAIWPGSDKENMKGRVRGSCSEKSCVRDLDKTRARGSCMGKDVIVSRRTTVFVGVHEENTRGS